MEEDILNLADITLPKEIRRSGTGSEEGNGKDEITVAKQKEKSMFVPRDHDKIDATGPMILQRKTTLTRYKIEQAARQ